MQDYGQTCGDRPGDVAYERGIDSALLQALEREGAKGIIADAGLKAYAAPERGEIMGDNGGRRT